MAKLRIIIHPLFFAFGIYFALIGKVFSFAIVVISALIHEFGHCVASERYGYKMDKIVLMPFGAIISGDVEVFRYRDEIAVAFAGPFINLFIVVFFVATWWVFPEVYAYTDLIVTINLSIAAMNLLPCYPLDGGRILLATLSLYMQRKLALKICRWVGLSLAIILLGLFVYSCFNNFNLSILFFAGFIAFGALSKSKTNSYIRIYSNQSNLKFKRGLEIKKYAINENEQLLKLLRISNADACEVVLVNDKGKVVKNLDCQLSRELLTEGNLNLSIKQALSNMTENIKKV